MAARAPSPLANPYSSSSRSPSPPSISSSIARLTPPYVPHHHFSPSIVAPISPKLVVDDVEVNENLIKDDNNSEKHKTREEINEGGGEFV
ncbi:hypothetical protein DEO72_LG3g2195 [Vigna unguiculata]|uniref:Uncharacterized protein n=1 Tax=Vigna unguiculata TaxID=3917 RepID=A0A4D6LGZ3_VIGUN|nr:hypothetical protein DEO72_LG3g2195 [Vigna unguiculata]